MSESINQHRHTKLCFAAMGSALCLLLSTQIPSSAHGEGVRHAGGGNVTILATTLPKTLTANTQLSGLAIVEIEPLSALGSNILHIQMESDSAPQKAVAILSTAYPHTKFELLEDFKIDDIGVMPDVQ